MTHSETVNELRFHAEIVTAIEEKYTPDFIVHGIHFGVGDPEVGGQHWNFTRSFDEDDEGVCTVKEIQEVTIYGGIVRCTLSRHIFICEFDEQAAQSTKTYKLQISFEIDDETWKLFSTQASLVFDGESYFTLIQ